MDHILHQLKLHGRPPPAVTDLEHVCRFTSFGRHFSDGEILNFVADKLVPFLLDGDILIDFSCGRNEFLPLVRQRAAEVGVIVGPIFAWDLLCPKNMEGFTKADWLKTTTGDAFCSHHCLHILYDVLRTVSIV